MIKRSFFICDNCFRVNSEMLYAIMRAFKSCGMVPISIRHENAGGEGRYSVVDSIDPEGFGSAVGLWQSG
jgi:hypothetical protein